MRSSERIKLGSTLGVRPYGNREMRKRNIPFFDVIYPKSDGEGGGEKQIQGRFIGRMKSEMHTICAGANTEKKSPRFRRKTGQAVILHRKRRIIKNHKSGIMNVTVIGVAGGTGSGKSTLVKRLQEAFKEEEVVTLCHDYYYKAHPELTYEERTKLNYDHPQSFDTDMLVEHIRTLKNNVPIEHPVYSFVDHNRTAETVLVKPSKVIIVDGILIFENKELRDLMDIKVYVDTDADIRLARRILRDVCERGRTMQSVISQYTTTVKPMHEEFVEPSKKYADVIIPEGGFNSVAVSMLIRSIQSQINAK